MAWLFLLVSVCLLDAGLVLGQRGCKFIEVNKGLNIKSWDAGAENVLHLPDMSDERECQNVCCTKEDCHVALMVTPADGSPQCFAVNCLKDGKNVCVLEASERAKVYIKPQISELYQSRTDDCRLERAVGHCRASFPRFYYDVTENACKTFVYGGCGGNGNNFKTKNECESLCTAVTGDVTTDPTSNPKINHPTPQDITAETYQVPLSEMTAEEYTVKCQAEMQVGLCRASIPRYYYLNGKCKRFRYGGCGGNSNNYKTEEECMKTCTVKIVASKEKPVIDNVEFHEACLVPSDSGPCRAAFSMYYFEPKTQSCEMFIFGGCKGNKNRYSSLEECMSKCAGEDAGIQQHGFNGKHWTPAFFMVSALTLMAVVLLVGLVLIWIRRARPQHLLVQDDRQELLPEEYLPAADVHKVVHS